MHVLIGLLTLVGVVIVVLVRMNRAARMGAEVTDTVLDVKRAVRRYKWSETADRHRLETVDDPVLAATTMMCAVAAETDVPSERQVAAIKTRMTGTLRLQPAEVDEMFAQAKWLAGQSPSLDRLLEALAVPIGGKCSPAEKRDPIAMPTRVAEADGRISGSRAGGISALAQRLGVPA